MIWEQMTPEAEHFFNLTFGLVIIVLIIWHGVWLMWDYWKESEKEKEDER